MTRRTTFSILSAHRAATDGPSDYLTSLGEAWAAHMARRRKNAPTVVSLFAGCGGSSLGYSMAGYRELAAVEWDAKAAAIFRANFPKVELHEGDIRDFKARGLTCDVLDGSPPCQGFSTAGARIIDDDRNYLFREFVRVLKAVKPKVFVMENVSGMVKGKMRLVFVEILKELRGAGYKVSARVLNAMYFGVPQHRERLIFVGVRKNLKVEPSHPKAQAPPIPLRDACPWIESIDMGGHGWFPGRVVEPSLEPSPTLTTQQLAATCLIRREYGSVGVRNKQFKNQPRSLDLPSVTLEAAARPRILRSGSYRSTARSEKAKTADRPSATLVAYQRPILATGENERELTLLECSLIGSFPSGFEWLEDQRAAYRGIGNSVPPLFMRAIAAHIKKEIL